MPNYIVELREYTDSGDYIENDYDFETKKDAEAFIGAVSYP